MHSAPQPYLAYKPSGIDWLGDIPAHWQVRRLKSLVANVVEHATTRQHGEKYIALEHIEGWTGKVIESEPDVQFDSQAKRFRAGDVLFGRLRPYLAKVVQPECDGLCVTELLVLRTIAGTITPSFLERTLRSKPFIEAVTASTYGAKMPRASWDFIGNMQYPIPPRPEQAAIARYLDRADDRIQRAISAKQRLTDLLTEQRQAIIHHAVTRGLDHNAPMKPSGIDWLGDVPAHWQVRRLKSVCRFAYGDTLTAEMRYDGDVPVYGSNGQVGFHSIANTIAPCIVIGRKGSFGKVNYVEQPVFAIDTTYFVDERYSQNDLRWLFYLLSWLRLDDVTKDSAIPGLGRDDAYQRLVPLPPLDEQAAIVRYLDKATADIDAAIANAQRQIDLLREYRTRLIADAVTGRVDARTAPTSAASPSL